MDDEKIMSILASEGYGLTDYIDQAIFILRNGALVDGEINYGTRANDHRMIEAVMENTNRYDPDFWSKVHSELGVVALVPETKTILIMENQILSEVQKSRINQLTDYQVQEYCKEIKQKGGISEMENKTLVIVQNYEQLQQMLQYFHVQRYQLDFDATSLSLENMDQVLILDPVHKRVECENAKKVLEDSNKLIMSVGRFMDESIKKEIKDPNQPSLYRIRGSDPISIYGIYHDVYGVMQEEDTFPRITNVFKNGEQVEIAGLKQGDFIEAYPDGKVKNFYNLDKNRRLYGPDPRFVFSDFSISEGDNIETLVSQGRLKEAEQEELEQDFKTLWEQMQQDSDYFYLTYRLIIRNDDFIEASQQVEDAIRFYVDNKISSDVLFDYKYKHTLYECTLTSEEITALYIQSVEGRKPLIHLLLEKSEVSVETVKKPSLSAQKKVGHKSLDERIKSAQDQMKYASQREVPLQEKVNDFLER